MFSKIEGANSSALELKPTGISIWLPMQVFGALWSLLLNQLSGRIDSSLIIPFNQRKMTLRDASPDAPRWIENQIDVLSWFIFLLKVPTNHELVRLWQVIDWAQINRLAAPYYHNAHGGRPAWAPAQLVAILMLMFLYGMPYETTIVRLIQENIVWCWFSGFGLFGPFPAHDALYEFRKRVGVQCFQDILTLAVKACMDAGLVDNKLIHFDLTSSEASAHRWSPYERAVIVTQALIRYLELVWDEQVPLIRFPESLKILAAEVALETLPHKALKSVKPERVVESVEAWHEKADDGNPIWQEVSEPLAQELAKEAPALPGPEKEETSENESAPATEEKNGELVPLNCVDIEKGGPSTKSLPFIPLNSIEIYEPVQEFSEPQIMLDDEVGIDEVSKAMIHTHLSGLAKKVIKGLPHARGDSDARVGRTTSYTWFCGYLIGFVVDDAYQVITAVVLGAGNVKQAHLFEPAIKAHMDRVGIPQAVAADSAFDDYQIHIFLDDKQIVGNVTSRDYAKPRDSGYGTDKITWKDGTPFCPADKPLQPIGQPKKNGQQTHQGTSCSTCQDYSSCYPRYDGKPKIFTFKPVEHRRWQENRQHNQTQEYKEAQRARFTTEGRFGLAKNNHHADRVPYRSHDYNLIAALMIATMMNWRILAKHQ